jgi:hypothetical protein
MAPAVPGGTGSPSSPTTRTSARPGIGAPTLRLEISVRSARVITRSVVGPVSVWP